MKENFEIIQPKNHENLNLPKGTLVFIEESGQLGFFERPSQAGFSKIENIGVMRNKEFRKPNKEDLEAYCQERNIREGDEQYKILQERVLGWERLGEESPSNEINKLIDEYNEIEASLGFMSRHNEIPEQLKEEMEKDRAKLPELKEKIIELKRKSRKDARTDEEYALEKVAL